MAMQLTMSLSSSGCRYFYPRNYFIAPQSSVVGRKKLVISQGQRTFRISSKMSSPSLEVVDGLDCLPNPKTPWLMLTAELDLKSEAVVDSFYSPTEHRVVRLNRRDCLGVPETALCFASAGEWLGFVDINDDCPVYLTNPFFCDKDMSVIRLPSLATLPEIVSVERDPQTGYTIFNIVETVHETDELTIDHTFPFEFDDMITMIRHLAISHLDPRHVDCVVTALQGQSCTLAYSRVWDDPKTSLGWMGLQEDYLPYDVCNQVVFSNTHKLFYTVNGIGIEAFDLFRDRKKRSKKVFEFSSRAIKEQLKDEFEQEENQELKELRQASFFHRIEPAKDGHYYSNTYHLVMLNDNGKSSDLLLLVRHFRRHLDDGPPEQTLHFDVFKVKFDGRSLVRLKTLEEKCVFVGQDQSFSLCSTKFPGLHPNSIYFIDTYHSYFWGGTRNNDRGIFNLNDNKIKPLSCPYIPSQPMHYPWISRTPLPWRGFEKLFWISPSNIIGS